MAKDIFDLFKDNEHKLNESPSPQTWDRIQNRMNTPRAIQSKRKTRHIAPPLGIAATLALILSIMVAFIWMVDKDKHQRAIAQASYELDIQELKIDYPTVNTQRKASQIAIQNKQSKPLKPINEGSAHQKLVAKTSAVQQPTAEPTGEMDSVRDERMSR